MDERHNHLDQARRDRGVCPACDERWAADDALIEAHRYDEVVEGHGRAARQRLHDLGDTRYGRPAT